MRRLLVLLLMLPSFAAAEDAVLDAMAAELSRSFPLLQAAEPAPYYASLQSIEAEHVNLVGEEGGLQGAVTMRARWVMADVRIGSPERDSSHPLRDGSGAGGGTGRPLPNDDDVPLLRRTIARELEAQWRAAAERWPRVEGDRAVRVEDKEAGADLAPSPLHVVDEPPVAFADLDLPAWRARIATVSARFAGSEFALDPNVSLSADLDTRRFVDTEGRRSRTANRRFRVGIVGDAVAPDGTHLESTRFFDAASPGGLPGDAVLLAAADDVLAELRASLAAKEQEPYRGPAVLGGRAAAVFFHEILGHRIEGHRLKLVTDAQTFRNQVGRSILPAFLSVHDDPTLRTLGGVDLRGAYRVDDQGIGTSRVTVVDRGVLRGFLETRAPVEAGGASNGHARRAIGLEPVSRQGNLIVTAEGGIPEAALRERLLAAAKRDGLPFGLVIDEIAGGFTFTDRDIPNAFQIDVLRARRVYVDGRPDEAVRGIDLIGTPLQTFSRIEAAADRTEVFNGTCGAESGWVPVSAAAPALLIGQIESQRKGKANALPPLLPPPPSEPGDPAYGDRVLSVLVGETRRAQAQLRLPVAGAPPPHRVTAELDDRLEFEARASFGALVNSALFRSRPTRLEVVVGDDVLDSRRWEGDEDDGSPARRPSLTVDDVPQSLARDLWLSADDSYKAALLRLHLKTSELQRRPDEQRAPDWTSEPGREAIRPRMALQFDRTAGEALVRAVSAALRDVPGLREGSAKLTVRQSNRYLVDTDGMRIVQPESLVHLRIELQLLLPDGESLADHRDYVVDAIDELPATSSLQRDAKEAASRLRARSEAPVVPYYEGPVMFEGRAASDFFRYLLANELAGTPPAPEAGASLAQTLNHAPRLGRRLLPRGWTVRDDPQRQVDSMPGGYAFDREGVPGDAIELVDDGVIVDLAMTRTPRPDLGSSNGHARGPVSAEPTARLSHWEVRPPRTLPGPAVRRQLRRSMRQARLDRLLVVRALAEGREGDLPDPTDAYFVLADGSEQPVRALQWDGVDRRTLRAIVLAAGTQTRGYVAPDRPGGYSPDGDGVPQTLTSPARLLVDSLELSWPGPDAARPVLPELPLDPAP